MTTCAISSGRPYRPIGTLRSTASASVKVSLLEVCREAAGNDAIDGDAGAATDRASERVRPTSPALAAGVDLEGTPRDRRHGSDVDNPAETLLAHGCDSGLRQVERPGEIDVQRVLQSVSLRSASLCSRSAPASSTR